MKIGIDGRLWNESGVGRYTRNLVSQLQIIDKKNSYVLFVRKNDFENTSEKLKDCKNWEIKIADVQWHSIEEQVKYPRILNKQKLDVMHFPYFSVPIFYNRPFVVTIHDLIHHQFPTGKASTLPKPIYAIKLVAYKTIILQAAKKAKKIMTVSHSVEGQIAETLRVPKEKIVVTYEGIDQKILAPTGRYENRFEKYFLYVGNAYPHKNLERLMDAFLVLHKTHPTIRLLCVGKNDYFYNKIKQDVIKKDLQAYVLFLHAVTDDQLAHLYDNALALVSPSLMEGFGLPVLEAMANECIVIASDIAVYKELCKENVLYCNPKNIESIVSSLKEVVVNNKKTFEKKLLAAKKHAQEFSWEKTAKQTLQVYEEAVSKK
jgi:glycosyltransferase involved in cell wall biosynthesis